jgi:hypothetical protein
MGRCRMSHNFTTELGRMRTEEAIARADRFRLAQQAQRAKSQTGHSRLSWSRTFAYRRALAAVGLSALMLFGLVAVAQARPLGPGVDGDGIATDVTATKGHPKVKGHNPGQPVRSEHAYDSSNYDPNAVALRLRAEYYRHLLGTGSNTDVIADARALNMPSYAVPGWSPDAVADARALNEPSGDPNAVALRLRAEYYAQRYGHAASLSTDAIADARALNEPSTGGTVDAIADARALNEPSTGTVTDPIAQLRAMNEPFGTTNVPGVEASVEPANDFPLVQSLAVIAGIFVLGGGALMVVMRNQQSPKTI